ncbi:NRAMP family divalent metal transporter [Streptacidiphilus fuscans]|uniref:Divalent metal cation transporter n=1 Tax=Streptacidiphilus fuscans TaxID=2789292 RepID=A0A931B272_9ACTN|nr:NRAMP family divalent metal transporter [Streptacidiphilus fuscans]MBF9068906.1 divalent metal cation transporter [Streptacidiphilus fuscans]MBF9073360.1 divalent metal cation transporter [Streptacidiphilus fuscans]
MASDTARPAGHPEPPSRDAVVDGGSAVLDTAHVGDIVGALGTIRQDDTERRTNWWHRIRTLLAIMGPGLIVMVGDNDAGGVGTYAGAGQNYGMKLAWTLALLIPVLYVNQEMVVRLGAVSGVGHARLIFERFGKFWGAFSVGDLFVVNALTIVTEFIGVQLALGYFGIPKDVAIPLGAALLFAVVAGGSFRRWERFLFALIALNIVMLPMAFMSHPKVGETAAGFIPQFPGGLNSTLLLVIVSIVGTTVAPWQLFFQQSNIVDKRITPRWIRYERADLWIGIAVVIVGAIAIMGTAAWMFEGTDLFGQFSDAGGVAQGLKQHGSNALGSLFAIVLLDAALVGANAVSLATTYTLGDTFKRRHSLHWKISEAPLFYVGYAILIAIAAAITMFSDAHVQGLITQGVQALAGVLLPSATVFLVLLCNDRPVLGPWVNTVKQNIVAGVIVWTLVLLSLSLTATVFFPNLTTSQLVWGFAVGVVIGVLGGGLVALRSRNAARTAAAATVEAAFEGVEPGEVRSLDRAKLSSADRKALLEADRDAWRTPALSTLSRPPFSPLRKAGLLTLRGYLLMAVILVVVKIVQMATGH